MERASTRIWPPVREGCVMVEIVLEVAFKAFYVTSTSTAFEMAT
jgi:hypothetical protein